MNGVGQKQTPFLHSCIKNAIKTTLFSWHMKGLDLVSCFHNSSKPGGLRLLITHACTILEKFHYSSP